MNKGQTTYYAAVRCPKQESKLRPVDCDFDTPPLSAQYWSCNEMFWNLKHLHLVLYFYFARITWTMRTAKRSYSFGRLSSYLAEDREALKFPSRRRQHQLRMVSTNADNCVDIWFSFNTHFMHCDASAPSTTKVGLTPFFFPFLLHFSTSNIENRGRWSGKIVCKVQTFWN